MPVEVNVTTFLNDNELKTRMKSAKMTVQEALEEAIIRDTDPYVPADTGKLAASASQHKFAKLGSGQIVYHATKPGKSQGYARFLWYGQLMVSPTTLSPWALAGEKKQLTNRTLTYSTRRHRRATSRWFEVSKKQNVKSWEKLAKTTFSKDWGKLI